MGNVASAVRGSRTDENSPQISNLTTSNSVHSAQTFGPNTSALLSSQNTGSSESWREQSLQQTSSNMHPNEGNDEESPAQSYEQDSHPLFPGSQEPSIHTRTERPRAWRHSTISRLTSRLLPDSVARGNSNNTEADRDDSHALQSGWSNRSRPELSHRRITSLSSDRFSITSSFRRRTPESRSDADRSNVRRLFHANADRLEDSLEPSTRNSRDFQSSLQDTPRIMSGPRRNNTRLSRVRSSISAPFSALLGSSHNNLSSNTRIQSPPPRSSRVTFAEDSDELLHQPFRPEISHEHDNNLPHELDATEQEAGNPLSNSQSTSPLGTTRRSSHPFRSRSTRLIRRGEHPPLSQVLQLAAAAIAAQLSGTSIEGPDGPRSLGGDTFDGSIHNFVQTLQDAASAQAGENVDLNANDGELPPVNFMRVFQFPNDENGTPLPFPSSQQTTNETESTNTDAGGDRSVTLVLVGVRSMPHVQDDSTGETGTLGPSLDTLLSLPFLPQANLLRNSSSGALFRRSDSRYRSQSRRHSMTNFNFPQQYESQRHMRTRSSNTRTADGLLSPNHNLAIPLSESPPGPNPPPSTPADIRSGNATPNRRPSSASMAHAPAQGLPDLNETPVNRTPTPLPAESAFNNLRQRRRSDSEFARRPELSSGNSRRNGVVEPDRPPPGAGRSWLIYVVGTNVAPDHPAFMMPSLFTENPTYEDMQMLSTLLGPAKPPVATAEDVETAGGLYRIVARNGILVAKAVTDSDAELISLNSGDRCLICLGDYEEHDSVRQIYSCRHMYHRECIDEWLTTGRNSCPMCRGLGVKEGSNSSSLESAEPVNDGTA